MSRATPPRPSRPITNLEPCTIDRCRSVTACTGSVTQALLQRSIVRHAPRDPCRSVTERLESWPVARLEREGLCLTGLRHRSTGRYYDRLLLRFGFGAESRSHAAAPLRAERKQSRRRHEFEVGDAVVMARQKDGGQALKGELVELSADAVAVAVSEAHTHAVDRHGDA